MNLGNLSDLLKNSPWTDQEQEGSLAVSQPFFLIDPTPRRKGTTSLEMIEGPDPYLDPRNEISKTYQVNSPTTDLSKDILPPKVKVWEDSLIYSLNIPGDHRYLHLLLHLL